jgi:hypothetical protein
LKKSVNFSFVEIKIAGRILKFKMGKKGFQFFLETKNSQTPFGFFRLGPKKKNFGVFNLPFKKGKFLKGVFGPLSQEIFFFFGGGVYPRVFYFWILGGRKKKTHPLLKFFLGPLKGAIS